VSSLNAAILLGAGFSHNWGWWAAKEVFNYLSGLPEIRKHERLVELLWQRKSGDGFEDAIAEVQRDYRVDAGRYRAELTVLQNAVGKLFADMNDGYSANPGLEFQRQQEFMVSTFLIQLETVFSQPRLTPRRGMLERQRNAGIGWQMGRLRDPGHE
jgi:hypothetical protein